MGGKKFVIRLFLEFKGLNNLRKLEYFRFIEMIYLKALSHALQIVFTFMSFNLLKKVLNSRRKLSALIQLIDVLIHEREPVAVEKRH